MIKIDDTLRLKRLEALREIVKALERRFPNHNSPFEYGTRLAEETGELIEALYEAKTGFKNNSQKAHLAKEQQDVLRVALGIMGLYNIVLPKDFEEQSDANRPKETFAYIVRLGIESGKLASTINHAEGMGVKRDKHGDDAKTRLTKCAVNVIQTVTETVYVFDTKNTLDEQIADSYRDYRERGCITSDDAIIQERR
jgi:NTP pyrophosphatase (non-canonical NTP hydrolase)